MQVTHVAEPDSHVIIGGGKTKAFQVKASAAAFKIMSDSLYRDKERAAVREIVCNAIDAHVMAGVSDQPVRVNLTDDELTVEDDGPGIHDDLIADIYCTLFASTKEGQDNQTGGFGLGSKAPFAISDHFTVTSRHQGVMTIYAMHVGDPATNGTPGAKPMMRAPCDKSGLTVSVPLAKGMADKIKSALQDIVHEGGMNVQLNGEKLPAPDYAELKRHGFGMRPSRRYDSSRVQVLYANVVYPVDGHEHLSPYINKLREFTGDGMSFLLYAPPSSISVTPSREALSYNEVTVGTLKKVLGRAVAELQGHAKRFLNEEMARAFKETTRENLPPGRVHIPRQDTPDNVYAGLEKVAQRWARREIDRGNYTEREIAKTLLRRPRMDRKRNLRIVASKDGRRHMSFELDRRDRLRRVIARVAAQTGTEAFLHLKIDSSDKPIHVSKPDSSRLYHYGRDVRNRVYISTDRTLVNRDISRAYVFMGARMKPQQIEALEARLKAFGLEAIVLKRPPAKIEKKQEVFGPPCPPRFNDLRLNARSERATWRDGTNVHAVRIYNPGTFGMGAAWLGLKATTIDYKPGFNQQRVPNAENITRLITQHIGKVVMAHTRGHVDALLAQNLPRIESLILDKLKERVAKKRPYEAFYARLALAAAYDPDGSSRHGYVDMNRVARDMLTHSRRFAHAAVREPYRANKDRDEAYAYWMMARTIFHERWAEGIHIDKNESAVITALVEEYRVLAQPLEARAFGETGIWERTQHLSLFEPFKGGHFASFTDTERNDFLDFAEELARRFETRQQKKDASQ